MRSSFLIRTTSRCGVWTGQEEEDEEEPRGNKTNPTPEEQRVRDTGGSPGDFSFLSIELRSVNHLELIDSFIYMRGKGKSRSSPDHVVGVRNLFGGAVGKRILTEKFIWMPRDASIPKSYKTIY
ncbi:hypothetical protein RUM43_011407 [Polyplax serrata]|uniref:Uncharacterized protein n=1 Tax=Polyplax serrata TaxID=468196 RepID=A0AAN8NTP7_POLSC